MVSRPWPLWLLLRHSYSALYDRNTDNPDTLLVQREDSREYILTEVCMSNVQMAIALDGQRLVQ